MDKAARYIVSGPFFVGGDCVASVYLEIDASELTERMERLRALLTPDQFQRIMYRVYSRAAGTIRRAVREDLPHQYHITPGEVGSTIGAPKITGWSCSIPVRGPKRKIGTQFSASGGAHGWNSLRRKYSVKAKIVKAGASVLPQNMASYGGQPPFRNLGSKLGGQTYTRAGKARGPILPVSGIAIPQMPMNRSRAEVQKDVLDTMKKRLEHEIQRAIASC